jgi:2-oxoglutarate dehydrogenase E1 component
MHKATPEELFLPVDTRITTELVVSLADQLAKVPNGFTVHPKLVKLLGQRHDAVVNDEPLDWGTVETLAYASLVAEGRTVRLSGQDAERGTFSHRHAVLHDFNTGVKFAPIANVGKGKFYVYNSHLSEAGTLGFEYGYSLADPHALTLWEAQFGDFANGAQVIIDQFISTGESKWKRMSGLVMLLPHGYEGQGPEHSSARLERFLQLCGRYNMQIANLTEPAQLFHALRRQVKRTFRKPLVIMSPKSLLRHPQAVSRVASLTRGGFREIIDDPAIQDKKQVRRVLLCSGKLYYELAAERDRRQAFDRAVVRIEQLYPWPERMLVELLETYPPHVDITWVQEEPRNMGAWIYLRDRWLDGRLGDRRIAFVGRPTSATPAVGSAKAHEKEQKLLIETALSEPVLS